MVHYSEVRREIPKKLGEPPVKAVEAVHQRRFLEIRVRGADYSFTVFRGRKRDYFLIPGVFCSCKDFELNVILRGSKVACYHLIGYELARRKGLVGELQLGSDEVTKIMEEVLIAGFSPTLRKLLYKERQEV